MADLLKISKTKLYIYQPGVKRYSDELVKPVLPYHFTILPQRADWVVSTFTR